MFLRLQGVPGPGNIAIATFGAGNIGSVPIAGFTETFMEKNARRLADGSRPDTRHDPGLWLSLGPPGRQ